MKKYLFVILAVSLFFILSGCATNIVYNRSVPDDESCFIKVHSDFTVVKFNEKKVRWKNRFLGYNIFKDENFAVVKIPAGEHKLILNYLSSRTGVMRNYLVVARGMELNYNFKAGETYTLRPMLRGEMVSVYVARF